MKVKSKLLIKIGILILLIVLMVVLMVISNISRKVGKNEKNNDENLNNIENQDDSYGNLEENNIQDDSNKNKKSLVRVTNTKKYFLMKQCIETYHSSAIGDKSLKIIDSNAKKEINIENLSVLSYYDIPLFCIDDIYCQEINDNEKMYLVYYRVLNPNSEVSQSEVMVRINTKNEVFSVFPYEYLKQKNYLNLSSNDVIDCDNLEEMNVDELTKYHEKDSVEDIVYTKELFDRYKFDLKYDNENLYKKISTKYKEKKFNTVQDLKNYIKANQNELYDEKLTSYKKTKHENYTELIGYTDKNKSYIFNVINIMDYTIEFDSYLVVTQSQEDNYEKLLPQAQAKYCIDRVIEAINNKDYDFVYDRLNPVLKNNYYKNKEDFVRFINNNFYDTNSYELEKDYLMISSNMYQFDVKVYSTQTNELYFNWLTMSITLSDNAEFKVSIVKKK